MLARATILRDYGSSPVADPGEGAGWPALPVIFRAKWGPKGRKNIFWRPALPVTSESGCPPHSPPSEGLDPPLQSNNRSQKFLLESGRRIGFFRLGRQIRLLYNKALEICIKHEKEKSRSGPESWRDFWHILSSFISQFLDLIQGMFSFFIRPQGFSLKKMAFSRLSFFFKEKPWGQPWGQGSAWEPDITGRPSELFEASWCHMQMWSIHLLCVNTCSRLDSSDR